MGIRIYGNRLIQTLPGLSTRPTSSRVREAIFNILQGQIAGSRWLDLCTGAGTMGAEALCRGARAVVGIDHSKAACRIIQANWTKVASSEQTFQIIHRDARQVLQTGLILDLFDFVYLDPPYQSNLYETLLPLLPPLLHPSSLVLVEHRHHHPLTPSDALVQSDYRHYGETGITFYQLKSKQDPMISPLC